MQLKDRNITNTSLIKNAGNDYFSLMQHGL